MRRVFLLLITAIILTAVACGAYLAYDRAMTPFSPPSLADYPIQGIDISHHQGDIDWARLKDQPNIRFAIMKATEGGDHRDRKFAENWQAAKQAGIVRGAYHFFTFCRPAPSRPITSSPPSQPKPTPCRWPSISNSPAIAARCRRWTNSAPKFRPSTLG